MIPVKTLVLMDFKKICKEMVASKQEGVIAIDTRIPANKKIIHTCRHRQFCVRVGFHFGCG